MSFNNFSTNKNSAKPAVPGDKTIVASAEPDVKPTVPADEPVATPVKPEVKPDVKPDAGSPAAK